MKRGILKRNRVTSMPLTGGMLVLGFALLGFMVSCSPRGHVYEDMGKEAVPPPVEEVEVEVIVEEPPPEEYVEVVETEHIHGPGCNHYYYDGEWHEVPPPGTVVALAGEAPADIIPATRPEAFEIYPEPSTAPGYEEPPPEVLVNVYEPGYYPEGQVIERHYYYYDTPTEIYYYDYYDYPRTSWGLSFGYGGCGSWYWGLSWGYSSCYYRPWNYCWDPWWYRRSWWGWSWCYYPWWHYRYPCHYYDHHDGHHRDDYNWDSVRSDRYPGPERSTRPIREVDGYRRPRGELLTSADRVGERPLIPVDPLPRQDEVGDVPRSPRAARPGGPESPERVGTRPIRPVLDDSSRPDRSPRVDAAEVPRNPNRPIVISAPREPGEARRAEDDVARLPAGTRDPSVERVSPPERRGSDSDVARAPRPAEDYSFRITPPGRGESTSRIVDRPTRSSSESRGVIVIPNSSSGRWSSDPRPVYVPPQRERPEVESNVRSSPPSVARTESAPRITTREPVEVTPQREVRASEPSRPSSPPPRVSRPEPPRSSSPPRPQVESPPRVESPSRPSSPPSVRQSAPSPPPRISRPSVSPRTVSPPRISAPPRAPEPSFSPPNRPSRPSGGGMRRR